ncbi:MAG: hypothetical protein ACW98A_00725 [Candidatus Hodarchaeales archaeon]|jgi:hypothetical protein
MMTISKSVAILVIFAVASTPAANVTANSSFYEQIFEAADGQTFETAVNNFFDESLNTIEKSAGGLNLYPGGSPTGSKVIKNNYYLETSLSSNKEIGFIELFFQLAGSRVATFNVKIIKGTSTVADTNVVVSQTGWEKVTVPNYVFGDFKVRVTGVDTVDGDAVKTYSSSVFTTNDASISSSSSYYHYYSYTYSVRHVYYETICLDEPRDPGPGPETINNARIKLTASGNCYTVKKYYYTYHTGWKWGVKTYSEVPGIKLQFMEKDGYEYNLIEESNNFYRIDKTIWVSDVPTTETKGYVTFPYLIAYYPHINGGPNYDLPVDFRIFIQVTINQEQGQPLSIDQDAFYDALLRVAKDPAGSSTSDWNLVTSGSTVIFEPLIDDPYSYQFVKRTIDGQQELVLTKKHLVFVGDVCVEEQEVYYKEFGVWVPECVRYEYQEDIEWTDQARVSSSSIYSTAPDDLILLALDPNGDRPETPYFWDWIVAKYEARGHTIDQSTKGLLTESHKLSPITNTEVNLIIDHEAPEGTNPYVVEVNVKDENGNSIIGDMNLQLKSGGIIFDIDKVVDGYAKVTLDKYRESVTAEVFPNEFFFGSQGTGSVQYDMSSMVRTQGAEGTDPIENTKFTIIREYIETSGAFSYDSTLETYTMINDKDHTWVDTASNGVRRGYRVTSNVIVTKKELERGTFEPDIITFTRYSGVDPWPLTRQVENPNNSLAKDEFFTFWLSQKLRGWTWGGNPPDPSDLTYLNDLASDTHNLLLKDQSWYQNNTDLAKKESAKVRGLTTKATQVGFPTPTGLAEDFSAFIDGIINVFMSVINAIFDVILTVVGVIVDFLTVVWDNILGPILGPIIEIVKEITNIIVEGLKIALITILSVADGLPLTGYALDIQNQVQNFSQNDSEVIVSDFEENPTLKSSGSTNVPFEDNTNHSADLFTDLGIIFEVITLLGGGLFTYIADWFLEIFSESFYEALTNDYPTEEETQADFADLNENYDYEGSFNQKIQIQSTGFAYGTTEEVPVNGETKPITLSSILMDATAALLILTISYIIPLLPIILLVSLMFDYLANVLVPIDGNTYEADLRRELRYYISLNYTLELFQNVVDFKTLGYHDQYQSTVLMVKLGILALKSMVGYAMDIYDSTMFYILKQIYFLKNFLEFFIKGIGYLTFSLSYSLDENAMDRHNRFNEMSFGMDLATVFFKGFISILLGRIALSEQSGVNSKWLFMISFIKDPTTFILGLLDKNEEGIILKTVMDTLEWVFGIFATANDPV